MRKFLLLFSAMLLTIMSAKAEVVTFVADGASVDATDKVTIANSGNDGVTASTYTKDGVCSVKFTKKNSSTSNVNGAQVRWYANDVMTIECLAGTKITGLVLKAVNATYGKATVNVSVDGGDETTLATNDATPFTRAWTGNATKNIVLTAGAQVRFTYLEVTYTPGAGVDVAAPAITYGDAANTVALSTETEGASIYYTLDGTEPTTASTLYTAPFAISEVTVVKAVAVAGGASSAVSTATMRLNKVTDLAAFVANANSLETLVAAPVTAIYQNGRYLYLKDANDNYLLAYNDKDLESVAGQFTENGDVISEIAGTYKSQNGLPELLITSVGDKSAGSAVEPIEVNVSDVDLSMLNQYLTFGPVSIAAATAANNYTATDADGNTITLYNQFNNATYSPVVEVPSGEGFYVTGFVSVYGGKVQMVPVSIDGGKVIETVATPVISPASGSLEAGTLITIECATEGAKIYYTTEDDAPAASSVTSLLYDGPISFTENMTIKAIAVKDGWYDSEVAEATFTLVVAGETEVTYNFTVDNGIGESSKEDLAAGSSTSNGQADSLNDVTLTQGDVAATFSIGEGTTDPKWWAADQGLRIYKNNTVTFTLPAGYSLISIVANQGTATAANFNKAKFSASTGSMDTAGHTWTPAEGDTVTSVTLTQQSGENGRLGGFTVKYVSNGLGAVEEIEVVDVNAPVEFYNLQGVNVSSENLAPGIYVVRQGAKSMKVLVK